MNQLEATLKNFSTNPVVMNCWRGLLTGTTLITCYFYFFRPDYFKQDIAASISAVSALIFLAVFWTYFVCRIATTKALAEISELKESIHKWDQFCKQLKQKNKDLEDSCDRAKEETNEYIDKYRESVAQCHAKAEELAQKVFTGLVLEKEEEIDDKLRELDLAIEASDEEKKQYEQYRESLAEIEEELRIDHDHFEALKKQVEKLKDEVRGLSNANYRHRSRALYSEKIKNEFKEFIVSSGLKTRAQCTTWERSVASRVKQEIEGKGKRPE